MCNIPLLDIPLEILRKYTDYPACKSIAACPYNQKMNSYLKEIADLCLIKKNLTTHTARHSYTSVCLANGVSIENVAKMLGPQYQDDAALCKGTRQFHSERYE